MYKRGQSISARVIACVSGMTIGLLATLGIAIFIRVKNVNDAQFSETVNNTVRLTDTTLNAFFKGMDGVVSLFSSSYKITTENHEGRNTQNLLAIEKSILSSNENIISAAITLDDDGTVISYPDDAIVTLMNEAPDSDVRKCNWYKEAMSNPGATCFSPAFKASNGRLYITASQTITDDEGNNLGVVSIEIYTYTFGDILGNKSTMNNIKFILLDTESNVLLDPFNDVLFFKKVSDMGIKGLTNYKIGDELAFTETLADGKKYQISTQTSQNDYYDLYYAICIPLSYMNASTQQIIAMVFVLLIIGSFISILVTIILARGITQPIIKVKGILKNISQGDGDLTVQLPILKNDEIGELCEYFNLTIKKIGDSMKSIISESTHMKTIGESLSNNMASTSSAVNQISTNIGNIKNDVINQSAGVEQTNATMSEIAKNIEKLNNSIASQSASVVQSSASIEEMIANIRSVTTILEKNSVNVKALSESAENGRALVSNSVETTNKISEDSEGLIEASTVIQNIASQTNLLAMNAAIEAAHAGESGKGFAVVADEIRKLAEESNTQGKKINEVLSRLREMIMNMATGAQEMQKQFDIIFEHTTTVSTQERVIKDAMNEQSSGGKQIIDAIHEINSITADVKDSAAVMEKGSKEVLVEMEKLATVTTQINSAMSDMSSSVGKINNSMKEVNSVTVENHESINRVSNELGKFKV